MTDLDPLQTSRTESGELQERAGRERPAHRAPENHMEMEGPSGREMSTELVGDPDRGSVGSGGQSGAGAGILAGATVAGPIGLPIGAAIGAVAGAASEAGDKDRESNEDRPLADAASSGTGPVDPGTDYMGRSEGETADSGRG